MTADNKLILLLDLIRGASKFLHRDYFELENLQSSTKGAQGFVAKARSRVLDSLQLSLSKYYKLVIFDDKDLSKGLDFQGSTALVEVLDGAGNFERAIPFFGLVITILKKKDDKIFAEKVVLNFPVLGSVYYAEKGKGAWMEKHSGNFAGGSFRLRVSAVNKLQDALVSCNYSELDSAAKLSTNIRIFGSCAYHVALVASGKADFGLLQNRGILNSGFDLLIREAGGWTCIKNNLFIASNFHLREKSDQVT